MIVGAVIAVGFWVLVVVLPVWCLCVAAAEGDRLAERAMAERKRKRGGEW